MMLSISRGSDKLLKSPKNQPFSKSTAGEADFLKQEAGLFNRLRSKPSTKSRTITNKSSAKSSKAKEESKVFGNLSTMSNSSGTVDSTVESDYESGAGEVIIFSGNGGQLSVSHAFTWAPTSSGDVTKGDGDLPLIAGTSTFLSLISNDERCPANPMTHIGVLSDVYLMEIDNSNTPLHCACILHRPVDEILKILEIAPEMANIQNKSGEYPLHYACLDERGVDTKVFRKLLELNPEAARTGNCERSFPLHLHCMVGAPSIFVVKELIKAHSHICAIQSEFRTKYDGGKQQVQIEDPEIEPRWCINILKEECWIPSVLANKPQRWKVSPEPHIEQGWCPLHLAVIGGASGFSIRALYDARPACYKLQTSQGRTPYMCLHLAKHVQPDTMILLNKIEKMQAQKRKEKEMKEMKDRALGNFAATE